MKEICFRLCLSLSLALHGMPESDLLAAEKVYSVEDLNAEKAQWSKWVDQKLKVEGQVISFTGRNQFRLKQCELPFYLTEDQVRSIDIGRNVELSGFIRKESGKLFFAANRVKVLGSHIEQFVAREAKLKSATPDEWYELARWAAAAGKFYEDQELVARSQRAWEQGLQLERAELPADDAEARLKLAHKVHELQPGNTLESELVHEAARLKWQAARQNGKQSEFLAWLKQEFPASENSLESYPDELNHRYEANPLATFRQADDNIRGQLARLFALEVELARILPQAKEDGSNAIQIADELSSRAPERTDLIKKYQDLGLTWRLATIDKAPRQEALRLADTLRKRDQPDEAKSLLISWIRAQESKVLRDDPVALLQLADDYLQLVEDEPAAAKLYLAAYDLDSSLDEAGQRLRQLGYRWDQTRWIKADGPDSMKGLGKSSGQLSPEMTTDQVQLLLGKPTGISRIFNGKGVYEVWCFGPPGTSRLLVHFQGAGGKDTLKVKRFLTE